MGPLKHRELVENKVGSLSDVHSPDLLMEEMLFLRAEDITWCHPMNNACFRCPASPQRQSNYRSCLPPVLALSIYCGSGSGLANE